MRSSSKNNFDFIPNLPVLKDEDQNACVSFMFYDAEKEVNGNWVDWLETIFLKFNSEPDSIIFQQGGKTKRGKYINLRESFLSSTKNNEVDFQIRSVKKDSLSDFFPSAVSISINASGPGKAQGAISLTEELVPNISDFSSSIASELFSLAGSFYGHSSRFPIILGPDSYAAGVGAIPKGWSFASTRPYTNRLTNWRKKTNQLDSIPGSFREVFPINFLKKSHLEAKISGRPAKLIFEKFGSIIEVSPTGDQYMWLVESVKLKLLRNILEKEGLILSSD